MYLFFWLEIKCFCFRLRGIPDKALLANGKFNQHIVFAFYPKKGTTRKRKKEDVAKNYKKIHELENGMVPLPAKVCFHCNK